MPRMSVTVEPDKDRGYDYPIYTKEGPRWLLSRTVLQKRTPQRDIKQWCFPALPETVTVLHRVPTGAVEMASFDDPVEAIENPEFEAGCDPE